MTICRRILAPWLAMVLFLPPVWAAEPSKTDQFNEAYRAYAGYSEAGDWQAALPHAQRAYAIAGQLLAPDSPSRAGVTYNYGYVLLQLDSYAESKRVLEEAVKLYDASYGPESEELIPPLLDLARARAGDRPDRTPDRGDLERVLEITHALHGKESTAYGQRLSDIGAILVGLSNPRRGKPYLYDAYRTQRKVNGPDHLATGLAAYAVGEYAQRTGDYPEAITYLNLALASGGFESQPPNAVKLYAHAYLVQAYEMTGERDDATRHCLVIGQMTRASAGRTSLPVHKVAPIYPRSEQVRGAEGRVEVEFEVDESGFVQNPKVVGREGGDAFVEASLEALKGFRYAPRFEGGKPVVTRGVSNLFTFSLE